MRKYLAIFLLHFVFYAAPASASDGSAMRQMQMQQRQMQQAQRMDMRRQGRFDLETSASGAPYLVKRGGEDEEEQDAVEEEAEKPNKPYFHYWY